MSTTAGAGPGEEFLSPGMIGVLAVGLILTAVGIGGSLVWLWPSCDGRDGRCPDCTIQERASLPKPSEAGGEVDLSAVTPPHVPVNGCNEVQLEGKGFQPGARVRFGGVECEARFESATILSAPVPPHPPGAVTVAVTNPDGRTAVRPDALTYVCPAPEEWRLLLLIMLAGAMGGTLHSLRSLYWYVGNRDLRRSWVLMYVILPFSSGAMAVVFYLLIRGGFWSPSKTSDSYVVVIAVGTLVGMFSVHASLKLKQLADAILTQPEGGRNSVPQHAGAPGALSITTIRPDHGPRMGGNHVEISGSGFVSGATVIFGTRAAVVRHIGADRILLDAPAADPSSSAVDVVVNLPAGAKTTATKGYTYDDALSVSGIAPASGSAAGNQVVKITGTGFGAGTKVTIGGGDAAVTNVAPGTMDVTTPAFQLAVPGTAQRVDVVVDAGGERQTLAAAYEYRP